MAITQNRLRIILNNIYENVFKPIEIICSYLMVMSVFLTVMLRELFKIGIPWGYEIAAFWAVIITFLAMPHNLHEKADLRVGVIYDMFRGKVKAFIDIVHYLLICFVVYGMLIAFYQYVTKLGNYRLPATNFPNWLFFGMIGVGVAISAVELIARIIDVLFELRNKKGEDTLEKVNGDKI